jgi:hypothetical protein
MTAPRNSYWLSYKNINDPNNEKQENRNLDDTNKDMTVLFLMVIQMMTGPMMTFG